MGNTWNNITLLNMFFLNKCSNFGKKKLSNIIIEPNFNAIDLLISV